MKNPKLIVKPFAKNGQKNVIPENYETSMESNQATWDQGFGQITMLPVAAGGLPPKGQDFNGIFNQISENIVYLSQGGRFKFSAEYAEAIGGYPKGAILQSDDEKKEYLSLIDNNKVDFNTASDISASWKLVNTDDLLAQIASKQPKGDYATKTELNSGLAGKQPVGDYATKTEVNSKLAKDQNGADIPDKPKFIENLGLPEVMSNLITGENIPASADLNNYKTPGDYYQNSSDLAASGKNYPVPYAGHLRVEKAAGVIQIYRHYITGQQWQRSFYDNSWTIWLEFSHIRPGKIELTGFRNGEVDFGWYLMNGDRYPVTSLVGKALLSLSANFRQDWGIVESGGMINIPDIQQADGRTPFLRPINKTGRQVGSVEQDAQRKITGFLHDVYGGNSLSVDGAFDKSAVFETTYYASRTQSDLKFKFIGNCNFDSSSVTQTASENRSLNIGMNAVIYLGV